MKNENNKPLIIGITAMLLCAVIISAAIAYAAPDGGSEAPDDTDIIYSAGRDECFPSMLPDRISYSGGISVQTPYGSFVPFDKALENNEYLIINHTVLTHGESMPYITPEGDEKQAGEIMKRISELSGEICVGCTDDLEKAKALAMWTGENLIYDRDAAESSVDLSVTSLEAILENDYKTTCAGFANFYSALCHAQGIYCINLKGGSSGDGWYRADLMETPTNHEWSAVCIDGAWYFADCTWISDRYSENGETAGGEDIKPFYAQFGFEAMSTEHRIDRSEHRCYGADPTK